MTAHKQHPSVSFISYSTIIVIAFLIAHSVARAGTSIFNSQSLLSQEVTHRLTDTIVSGIVKDKDGKPIANAKVSSTVSGDIFTNSDGLFSITLRKGNIIPQSFIFSYDTLLPVIRSYHPVMENAMYEIVLEPKKCCCDLLIGKQEETLLFPSVNFKPNSVKLSGDVKAMLKEIAATLRDKPEARITLTAYPAPNEPKQRISDKRLQSIAEYLIEQEGISSDRIQTEKKPAEGDGNTIDIKKQ